MYKGCKGTSSNLFTSFDLGNVCPMQKKAKSVSDVRTRLVHVYDAPLTGYMLF